MVVLISLFVSSAHICGHCEVGERNLVMKNAAKSMADEINSNAKLESWDIAKEVEEPNPVSSQARDFLHPSVHWNIWIQSENPALNVHEITGQAHDGEK